MYIEPFVPYDKSILWEIHNKNIHTKGFQTWPSDGSPFHPRLSLAMVRQHARFLCTLYEQECKGGLFLEGDPFYVLEIGSGLGLFASHLFYALANQCGKNGAILAQSMQYILSSHRESMIRDAMEYPGLQQWKQQLIPALFNLETLQVKNIDGTELTHAPSVLFANYVCSVTPTKKFRFSHGQWSEEYAQVQQTQAEWEDQKENHAKVTFQKIPISYTWEQVNIEEACAHPQEARLIKRLPGTWTEATFNYPYAFINMLLTVQSIMNPRGYIIISDHGRAPCEGDVHANEIRTQHHKGTLYHLVDFAIFSEFAQLHGWAALLTPTPTRSTHHTCLRIDHSISQHVEESFSRNYSNCFDGEDLPIFWDLAQGFMNQQQYTKAAYFAGRCAELEPMDPHYPFLACRALIAEGKDRAAQYYIERGHALPTHEDCNFLFQMGRVAVHLGYLHDAVRYYKEAADHSVFPALYSNHAYVLLELNQLEDAHQYILQSLVLDQGHVPTLECEKQLKERIWNNWKETKN
jgi:tetratricopeptide (TPR) repeat protein